MCGTLVLWILRKFLCRTDLQILFYVYGFAGTGKSTFGLLISYLVGEDATYTTSLKALKTDIFEIANLIGKKLVIINDTEKYSQDLSILKAYVGGDSLRGRVMYTQGTTKVISEEFIIVIGNLPLSTRDNSNAIVRRRRPFKGNYVPEKKTKPNTKN